MPSWRHAGSVALLLVALAASLTFLVGTAVCGVQEVEANHVGAPPPAPTCVRAIHPAAVVATTLTLASGVALALGERSVPVVGGIAAVVLGIPFVFSGGLVLSAVGLLSAAAGLLWPQPPPPESEEQGSSHA